MSSLSRSLGVLGQTDGSTIPRVNCSTGYPSVIVDFVRNFVDALQQNVIYDVSYKNQQYCLAMQQSNIMLSQAFKKLFIAIALLIKRVKLSKKLF